MRKGPLPEHVKANIRQQLAPRHGNDAVPQAHKYAVCGICGNAEWVSSTPSADPGIEFAWAEQPCQPCGQFQFANPHAFSFILRAIGFTDFVRYGDKSGTKDSAAKTG